MNKIENILTCGRWLRRFCLLLAFGSFVLATSGKMSVALKQWIIKQSHLMIKDDWRQQAVTAGCDSETWLLLIHSKLSLHVFRVNIPHVQSFRVLMRSKSTASGQRFSLQKSLSTVKKIFRYLLFPYVLLNHDFHIIEVIHTNRAIYNIELYII